MLLFFRLWFWILNITYEWCPCLLFTENKIQFALKENIQRAKSNFCCYVHCTVGDPNKGHLIHGFLEFKLK